MLEPKRIQHRPPAGVILPTEKQNDNTVNTMNCAVLRSSFYYKTYPGSESKRPMKLQKRRRCTVAVWALLLVGAILLYARNTCRTVAVVVGSHHVSRSYPAQIFFLFSDDIYPGEHNISAGRFDDDMRRYTDDSTATQLMEPAITRHAEEGCEAPIHGQPTCNDIHALDVAQMLSGWKGTLHFVNQGQHRNVWNFTDSQEGEGSYEEGFIIAWKTPRWETDFSAKVHYLHTVESVALNYLTGTPHVSTIYGFCGIAVLSDYANIGFANTYREKVRPRPMDLLDVTVQLSRGLASVQEKESVFLGSGYDRGGTTLQIVHRDMGSANMLFSRSHEGQVVARIDDFNTGEILYKYQNGQTNEGQGNRICSYRDEVICGKDGRRTDTRSPEECRGNQDMNNSVDTYGLGTFMFYLLSGGRRVFNLDSDAPGKAQDHPEWYRKRVTASVYPQLPESITNTTDGALLALVTGMKMCMTSDPAKRPSALNIHQYLKEEYLKLKAI